MGPRPFLRRFPISLVLEVVTVSDVDVGQIRDTVLHKDRHRELVGDGDQLLGLAELIGAQDNGPTLQGDLQPAQ